MDQIKELTQAYKTYQEALARWEAISEFDEKERVEFMAAEKVFYEASSKIPGINKLFEEEMDIAAKMNELEEQVITLNQELCKVRHRRLALIRFLTKDKSDAEVHSTDDKRS